MTAARRVPRVTLFADTDLVHGAYLATGLLELESAGEISLRFGLRPRLRGARGPFTTWFTVEDAGRRVNACADFHDLRRYFCAASLPACDVYLKANYECAAASSMGALSARVRPFGPYFPSRPRADRALPLRSAGSAFAHLRHRLLNPGRRTTAVEKARELASQLRRIRRYRGRHAWPAYEAPPVERVPSAGVLVFFNPTCWAETDPSIAEVNRFRAELIVGLRRALGARFAGGFRRNAHAVERYPDALEDRGYSHDAYVRLLREAPISVYTNGLDGCFSWRFVEVFAASRCVVSEVVPNDPGFPLGEEQGVVQRSRPEELVARIEQLASRPEEIVELSRRAARTYETWLRPAQRARLTLQAVREAAA